FQNGMKASLSCDEEITSGGDGIIQKFPRSATGDGNARDQFLERTGVLQRELLRTQARFHPFQNFGKSLGSLQDSLTSFPEMRIITLLGNAKWLNHAEAKPICQHLVDSQLCAVECSVGAVD